MQPSASLALAGKIIALGDERYPELLRAIPDPPPVLYCDGMPEPGDRQAVAIVGSRQATPYGLRVTDALAGELSALGFTIVSGFARGIDAAAHRAALATGGRTIAVLGCGLDVDYPPGHASLRAEIAASGAVLTEFIAGTPPRATNFPRRNRIISGLALGVVVVEATEESGSLITARLALEQGREVFAVPGPVDASTSRGPHGLIKQGAKLVETVDDIVEELLPQLDQGACGFRSRDVSAERRSNDKAPAASPGTRTRPGASGAGGCNIARSWPSSVSIDLSAEEQAVFGVMSREPLHLDELTERSRLTSAEAAGILLGLELKGVVRQLPGQRYCRIR